MTKQQKARAHLARAQELLGQGTLAFGGDEQTTLDIPSNQKTYNQFGTGPLKNEKRRHYRYHPYMQENEPEEYYVEQNQQEAAQAQQQAQIAAAQAQLQAQQQAQIAAAQAQQQAVESHCMLNPGNLECVHYHLPQQFPNKDYEIMAGIDDSGWRLAFKEGFTFYLYHYTDPWNGNKFNGHNAPSETADMIHKYIPIPNAWMPDLDNLARIRPELRLKRH